MAAPTITKTPRKAKAPSLARLTADLVFIRGDELWTTSLAIAEKFGKKHYNVLRDIAKSEAGEEFTRLNFEGSEYTGKDGRKQPMFYVSESGFMFLAMGFTGKEAAKWKVAFIAAFRRMAKELGRLIAQRQNEEWRRDRLQGKLVRRTLTDAVQLLVLYARGQESQNAEQYYLNLTKAAYRALFEVEDGVYENLRERLNSTQLVMLAAGEEILAKAVLEAMETGLPYKDVYTFAKERVVNFGAMIGKSTVPVDTNAKPLPAVAETPALLF